MKQVLSHITLLCFTALVNAQTQTVYVPDMSRGYIVRLDVANGVSGNVTTGETRPVGVAFDSTSQRVIWTDVSTNTIRACNTDGSGKTTVYSLPGSSEADFLAIDSSAQRLYYTDTGTNTLAVVGLDGSSPQTIISANLESPLGIALNLAAGTMYWTEAGSSPKIERSNLDGSARQTIISTQISYPTGIAVDSATSEIFWADYIRYTIDKASLTGTNRANIITETGERFYGIAIDSTHIYVTSWSSTQVRRFPRAGGLGEIIGSQTFGQQGAIALSTSGGDDSTVSTTTTTTTVGTGPTSPPSSTTTTTTTTTTSPIVSDVAFCATRSSSLTPGGDNVIYYDNVLLNDGGGYDLVSSQFAAPREGLYWLHFNVGIDVNGKADVYMMGTTYVSNVIHGDVVYNGQDTTSRDEIFHLHAGCNVQVLSAYRVYSDNYLQTSFSGFSLQGVSDSSPATAFSVQLSSSLTCADTTKVPFDLVALDTKGAWDASTNDYVIPTTGTYVISLHTGSQAGGQHAVGVYVVGSSSVITTVQLGSTNHELESLSKTVLLELTAGNRIYAGCLVYVNSFIGSGLRRQTTMTGFLYSPTRHTPRTWSVASVSTVAGPADPVQFLVVLANLGSGWSSLNHQYTVQQAGVYYVTFTAGVASGVPTRMELLVNNVPVANVFRASTNHTGISTRSTAIIQRYAVGDVLKIRLPTGFTLYSSDQRITAFSGFFLYP